MFPVAVRRGYTCRAVIRLLPLLSALVIGSPAVPVVRDVDGLLRLAHRGRGNLVVLHFWATWCGACRADLPRVRELQRGLATLGVPIVGASLDRPEEAARVANYAREQGLAFPNAVLDSPDPDPVVARLDPAWGADLPATFLVDGSGKTLRAYLGATPVERVLEDVRRYSGGSTSEEKRP